MSAASGLVAQLCRAHYSRNDSAFASAALTLARSAKSATVRASIIGIVQAGAREAGRSPQGGTMRQLPPPTRLGENSLLEHLPKLTFEDLLASVEIQVQLDELVTELEYREELAERNLRARNRLLFWGPPGNGKTSHATAMATALGVHAFGVSLPRLVGSHLGETGENLGRLFDGLREDSLVVFDELDAVGSMRGHADQAASKEMNATVNVLLTLLDRCRRGVIVATTNRPDIIDPALLRRFDERIEFPEPSLEQMNALSAKLCERYGIDPVDVLVCRNFDDVAKVCEREARRQVMAEILAAEEAEEPGDEDGGEAEEDDEKDAAE